MSEEVGKALQSVVERLNQAAARRPKVTTTPGKAAPSGPGPGAASAAVTLARDSEQKKWLILQPHDPPSYVRLNRTPQPLDSRRLVARQHFRNTMLGGVATPAEF